MAGHWHSPGDILSCTLLNCAAFKTYQYACRRNSPGLRINIRVSALFTQPVGGPAEAFGGYTAAFESTLLLNLSALITYRL